MGELPRDDCYQEDLTVGFGGDEGHAIEVEAGSLGTWSFRYRCGDQPVRDGGAISYWNDQTNVPCAYLPQTDDPSGWDYVTVETDGDAELELVHLARTYKDNRFCELRVVRGELRHGDEVVLRVGGGEPTAAPAYSIERINYYVAVDHAGDGTWTYLPYCVTASIVPGPPAKLGVTAPSVVGLDEPFALHVRAEDASSNPGAAYVGELRVSLDGVELVSVSVTEDDGGIVEVEGLRFERLGVHRLTVTTGDGSISGTSNPTRCRVEPSERIYWGDMHCHADYADATGTAEWNHGYARNKARLDFYSLTDHIYSTPGRATGAFNRPPVLDVRKMWEELQRTARAWHEPGRFVTFLGYERTPWERRRAAGDLTVWFMEDDADLVIEDTIAGTIESVRATSGKVFIGSHAAQRSDWQRYGDGVEDVMPTIEISAMHQHAEWYVFEGLQRGYKFASVGMADEHAGHPGYDVWPRFGQGQTPRRPFSVRSALTAVFAPELTRKGVRDAFFGRRTYATTGDRILLDVQVNGEPAGSEVASDGSVELRVVVHGTAPIERVDIIRGDRLVHTVLPDSLDASVDWTDPAPLAGETWYYVRVTQANGGFAWSTPTWVTTAEGEADPGDLPQWCDVIWPPAPKDRGPDARDALDHAARVFGENPARFADCVQIGRFEDYRGSYVLFRGRDGRDGAPLHVHLYDEFPAPRLYVSRGWADFGWGPNGGAREELPWPEPTGEWA